MAIETILLPVGPNDDDRVDSLAAAVIDVAGPTGATVVLAHVFTDDEFESIREQLAEGKGDIIEQRFHGSLDPHVSREEEADLTPEEVVDRLAVVRDLEEALSGVDVDYEIRGVVGPNRGERIVELAETVGADLLFVGGRRRSPAGKAVFGSTAQEVMLSAPCPVTFVRRG